MIYFLMPTEGGPVKIGFSRDVDARRAQLEAHYGKPLALLATMPGGKKEEQAIHERFAHLRLGRTEQFQPASDLMAFIGRPLLVGPNPDAVETMCSPIEIRLRVGKDLYRRIARAATEEGLSVAALIRTTMIRELKRRKKEAAE